MKLPFVQIAFGCLLALSVVVPARSQSVWRPTNASVTFKIRNAGLGVDGTFGGFVGTLRFDPANPATGKLAATVEAATLNTGIGLRDGHLKKEDYFDVTTHPRISLTSVSLEKKGNAYSGVFDLTLKGTTRRVTIPFTFTQTGNTGHFVGQFTINRLDYKVGKSNMFLSDNVTISLDVQTQLVSPNAVAGQ